MQKKIRSMRTIIIFILLMSISVIDGEFFSSDSIGFPLDKLPAISCPDNNKNAEKEFKTYLSKDISIKDLRKNYDIDVDHTSHNQIQALDKKMDQAECKKFIEKFDWIKNDNKFSYSFYKVADHYFVVRYLLTQKDEFEFKSITIINNKLKALSVVLNFETEGK